MFTKEFNSSVLLFPAHSSDHLAAISREATRVIGDETPRRVTAMAATVLRILVDLVDTT